MVTLHLHARKFFKKALKKAGFPYGAESHVEVNGFLADVISNMNIQPNDRILDIGAGTGRNDLLMLGYLEEGELIGLEIGEEMKKQFRDKSYYHDNLKLRDLRIEKKLPFEHEFDKVFILFTLHGFKQKDRIKIIDNANVHRNRSNRPSPLVERSG